MREHGRNGSEQRPGAEELAELRAMDKVNAMEEARLDLEYEMTHDGKQRPKGWGVAAPKLAPQGRIKRKHGNLVEETEETQKNKIKAGPRFEDKV